MDIPHIPVSPLPPINTPNHDPEIAELKTQVATLTKEVARLKADVDKIFDKAKSFGLHR
jgi:peptidoglycan hydrolase CwlO-like protein